MKFFSFILAIVICISGVTGMAEGNSIREAVLIKTQLTEEDVLGTDLNQFIAANGITLENLDQIDANDLRNAILERIKNEPDNREYLWLADSVGFEDIPLEDELKGIAIIWSSVDLQDSEYIDLANACAYKSEGIMFFNLKRYEPVPMDGEHIKKVLEIMGDAKPQEWIKSSETVKTVSTCEIVFEYTDGIVRYSTATLDNETKEKLLSFARTLDSYLFPDEFGDQVE